MEENKKQGKGLVAAVVVLSILLVGAIGYICYDMFLSDGEKEVIIDNGGTTEKEYPVLDDAAIKELHSSLVTSDDNHSYGIYFKDNVSIDTITAEQLMPYVITNYVKENNISKIDLQCLLNDESSFDEGYCANMQNSSVSKIKIDNYINKLFNTDKEFNLSANNENNLFVRKLSDNSGFAYDLTNKMYYIGYIPSTGYVDSIHSKFVKSEQKDDEVYIYDMAFVCSVSVGVTCYSSVDGEVEQKIFSYYPEQEFPSFIENGKVDSDYVFENYADKLNNYKHTFKMAEDGKYYWVSSEIVE